MSDVEDRSRLEEERDFLLRSLDDLDAERAEGNVDDATYERLREDYTARAARTIRVLESDADVTAVPASRGSNGRRLLVGVGVTAFVAIAAVAMSLALGARLPGETVTGTQRPGAATPSLTALRADVRAHPKDPDAHLALARALVRDDPTGALEEFRAAAGLDPTNPEPFAYSGWLVRLGGFPDEAVVLFDKAIELDDRYPDVRFFKGITLLRDRSDPSGAVAQFQRYLVLAPDGPLADQVRTLLAEASQAAGATPTTTSTSPSP